MNFPLENRNVTPDSIFRVLPGTRCAVRFIVFGMSKIAIVCRAKTFIVSSASG